jgi:hypothetical protein
LRRTLVLVNINSAFKRTAINKFQEIQNNHLALTQYHRWYQVYEQPFTKASIENQLDILADDVEISSHAGTMKGKEGLPDRLKMYEGWQNAHHVQNTTVELLDKDTLKIRSRYSLSEHTARGQMTAGTAKYLFVLSHI